MFSDYAIIQTRKTFWLPAAVGRSRYIQTEGLSRLNVQPVQHCSRLTIMDYFKGHLHFLSGWIFSRARSTPVIPKQKICYLYFTGQRSCWELCLPIPAYIQLVIEIPAMIQTADQIIQPDPEFIETIFLSPVSFEPQKSPSRWHKMKATINIFLFHPFHIS